MVDLIHFFFFFFWILIVNLMFIKVIYLSPVTVDIVLSKAWFATPVVFRLLFVAKALTIQQGMPGSYSSQLELKLLLPMIVQVQFC